MSERETVAPAFQLLLHPRRRRTDQEELAFYRAAYRVTPDSEQIRLVYAMLLNALSEYEESCALLAGWKREEFAFLRLEIKANLGRKTSAAVEVARVLCMRALGCCRTDGERGAIQFLLADCLLRQARVEEARAALLASLELGGLSYESFNYLTRSEITQGRAAELAAVVERSLAEGPPTSALIAAQILSQAQLGQIDEARALQGLGRFLRQHVPEPPAGWETLEAFNRDLAYEIAHHPSLRDRVEGASSRKTRHVPQPDLERTPVYHAFQQMIQREVAAYCAALPAFGDHPFLRMRRPSGTLANWCVLTEGEGHETWHQHPGWLSGTYYVQVPDHITHGSDRGGCIAFGLPDDCATAEETELFGETVCRPRPGLLVLFPSYVHHRTYAHGGAGERICCAFDIELQG